MHALGVFFVDFIYTNVNMKRAVILVGNTAILRIGKEGATAKALRTILRVVGMKNNARVNLKINEPEGGKRMMAEGGSSSYSPAPTPTQASSIDEAMEDLKGI